MDVYRDHYSAIDLAQQGGAHRREKLICSSVNLLLRIVCLLGGSVENRTLN